MMDSNCLMRDQPPAAFSNWKAISDPPLAQCRLCWWEREIAALWLIMLAIYLPDFVSLPLHGEETRRAQVAVEMLQTCDWVVPREQGLPFLSRPPAGSWPIAVMGLILGSIGTVAARLPSLVATMLTVWVVYVYARQFLDRLGACTAGLAYATMPLVLQYGLLAENESLFTACVSGSLLLWHLGYERHWSPTVVWTLGYGLAAYGTLIKGLQGVAYFIVSVICFLVWRKQLRFACRWPHLVGMAWFVAMVGGWQLLFAVRVGWQPAMSIWFGDIALRFEDSGVGSSLLHLVKFPVELGIATVPWSVFLLLLAVPGSRRFLHQATRQIDFLIICLLVTFPTVWLTPGGRTRYFMPLLPLVAILVGCIFQYSWRAEPGTGRYAVFRFGLWALAGVGLLFPLVSSVCDFWLKTAVLGKNTSHFSCGLMFSAAAALLIAMISTKGKFVPKFAFVSLGSIVVMLLAFRALPEIRATRLVDRGKRVASICAELPENTALVSLGPVSHEFRHYYGPSIPIVPWHAVADNTRWLSEYFCFNLNLARPRYPDFDWVEVGRVSVHRWEDETHQLFVVVGRRAPSIGASVPVGCAYPSDKFVAAE